VSFGADRISFGSGRDGLGADRRGLVDVVGAWVTARLIVGLGFAAAQGVAATGGKGVRFPHLDEGLITWDATWYDQLARAGYAGTPPSGVRFFPLFHLLGRIISWPLGGNTGLALVIVANVCALVALWLLRLVVLEQFHDEDLARRSVWLMALFPSAGAFVFAYSESLMLLLSLALFLAMRRHRWELVALTGLLAGLCRPTAVLLCLPVAIEAARAWPRLTWNERSLRALATAAPVIGVASYLFYIGGQFGSWTQPIDEQRAIRKGFQDPITRLWDAIHDTLTVSQLNAPAMAFALAFIVLIVVAVRRQPVSWSSYAAATVALALSAPVIDSLGRYGLVAFPLVVALAMVVRSERAVWATAAVSGSALCALTVMSLLGGYIP